MPKRRRVKKKTSRSAREERCIRAVKKRLPPVCKRRGYPAGPIKVRGKTVRCYNPYAVCAASIRRKR